MISSQKMSHLIPGTKTDLRSDRMTSKELDNMGEHIVHSRKGKKLANRIGAVKYMECSARRGHGLVEVSGFSGT